MSDTRIRIEELSADECAELDLDETLRDTGGKPYVRVTIEEGDEDPHGYQFVGVLREARIEPEYLDEV